MWARWRRSSGMTGQRRRCSEGCSAAVRGVRCVGTGAVRGAAIGHRVSVGIACLTVGNGYIGKAGRGRANVPCSSIAITGAEVSTARDGPKRPTVPTRADNPYWTRRSRPTIAWIGRISVIFSALYCSVIFTMGRGTISVDPRARIYWWSSWRDSHPPGAIVPARCPNSPLARRNSGGESLQISFTRSASSGWDGRSTTLAICATQAWCSLPASCLIR